MNIEVSIEAPRGCGYRKAGGFYFVTDPYGMAPCGKLPIPADVCPTCSQGLKFARGFSWIDGKRWTAGLVCRSGGPATFRELGDNLAADLGDCPGCPLGTTEGQPNVDLSRVGLVWIGEKFYPTPQDWIAETKKMGISRRLNHVPRDFEVGKDWVFVAHMKVIREDCSNPDCQDGKIDLPTKKRLVNCPTCKGKKEVWKPAIFHLFKPQALEYVVGEKDSVDKLERLEKKGVKLVKVIRDVDAQGDPGADRKDEENGEADGPLA